MQSNNLPNRDPEIIRQTAREVLSRDHFQIDPSANDGELLAFLWGLLRSLLSPIGALFGMLSDISPLLAWAVIIALVLTLVAMSWYIIRTFALMFERRNLRSSVVLDVAERLRNPSEIELLASDAEAKQQYSQAVRLLLLATLLRLERKQERRFRPGVTNREHLIRYKDTPVYQPLRLIVDLIDRTWYGDAECVPRHVSECRDAYMDICGAIEDQRYADGA